MIHTCREMRPNQVIAKEWRDSNPEFKLRLDQPDTYRKAAQQLEMITGNELLASMDEVEIQEDTDGIWIMTGPSWEAILLTESLKLDIEAVSKLTKYAGIRGYYRGWPIIIGPGPRFGVRYTY